MGYKLSFTLTASDQFDALANSPNLKKRYKSVRKALGLLETNPRHPSLHTHKFVSLQGPKGEEIFEAYAENNIPAAYRIFWYYGPVKGAITIIAITPHP